MHKLDTRTAGVLHIAAQKWAAIDFQFARCWTNEASQNSGEGRFSGTVLANDGVDLATFEDGSDIGERNNGTISYGHIMAFKYGGAGLVHSSMIQSEIRALY
jgi:hypothetical protein